MEINDASPALEIGEHAVHISRLALDHNNQFAAVGGEMGAVGHGANYGGNLRWHDNVMNHSIIDSAMFELNCGIPLSCHKILYPNM